MGNTGDVKKSLIEYMESFHGKVYEPGTYIPDELSGMMKKVTVELSREVAVCLDRRNRVVAISLGDSRSVSLPDAGGKRSALRLSGIRLLHTHPNGSPRPSDVDLNSLHTMRYDSMIVIGVNTEKQTVTGISAAMLTRDERGEFSKNCVLYGPVLPSQKKALDMLYAEAEEIDRAAPERSEDNTEEEARAILVGVITDGSNSGDDAETELRELCELAKTAGAEPVAYHVQRRPSPDSKLYIGKGLASDLSLERQALDAGLIIFDDELSPSQIRNLEETIGARVIDRTALILDIFAARAKSREGALQVELAQQRYRLPRLAGTGTALSRLGGGIGTRGPGETKLQTDRRHILRRIHYLEEELAEVAKRRDMMRHDRAKRNMPVVALVGYTNAGKSTLLNALCESDVFAENMLFATLDPSVRGMTDSDGREYLMVDTVGFIRKLPHTLIEAFKSTLEEAAEADLLLHVAESDAPDLEDKIAVVNEILGEIGAGDKPRILVLNKTDKEGAVKDMPRGEALSVMCTDAVSGTGIEHLREAVAAYFTGNERELTLLIPYTEGWALPYLHKNGVVLSEEYGGEGTTVMCRVPVEYAAKVEKFTVEEAEE